MHVIVIGAGLLGVSSAYYLRRHGVDVTVLDGESGPAMGASHGNGGYVQASVADPWNAPGVFKMFAQAWMAGLGSKSESSAFVTRTGALPGLASWGLRFLKNSTAEIYLQHTLLNSRLARYSLHALAQIDADEGFSYSQSDTGGLIIFRSEEALLAYRQLSEQVCGEEMRFECLDRDALLQKEPSLCGISGELAGAVYFPSDHAGDSREFCEQLAATTTNQGTQFLFDTVVTGIDTTNGRVQISTLQEVHQADAVVIAAGVGSSKLAKSLGIYLPIAPAKGYSITIPMNDWADRPSHVIADMGVHAGVNPIGNALRVAGTAEFAGMKTGISEERVDYLIALTGQVFPEFAATIDPGDVSPWAGHRPLSADGLPILGSTVVENVYMNTGHGGLGWSQAAGSGRAVADQIVGVERSFDVSEYSIGRFSK